MEFLRSCAIWFTIWVFPMLVMVVAIYYISTLPARRKEKARLLLDLLGTGLQEGRSLEHTVTDISRTRDRLLGARFHLVAAYIEQGETLVGALEKVPRLLAPETIGILRAGIASNQVEGAIAAAKKSLGTPLDRTNHAIHYAFVLLMILLPFALLFLPFWSTFVYPKFLVILADLDIPMHPFAKFVSEYSVHITLLYAAGISISAALFAIYISGPSKFRAKRSWGRSCIDRFIYSIPWRRKRMHRDFSLQLALLLEAGFPEKSALELAGDGTGNMVIAAKARRAMRHLSRGESLPRALSRFESEGQFSWRMSNALKSGGSFLKSLKGWHEALESEATRSEEAAAHMITSVLIVLNGFVVGTMVIAVFLALNSVISQATLW